MADSIALSGVRRFGSSYPAMRIWGSLAFLTASSIGGLVLAATSSDSLPVMISVGFVATLAAALATPRLGPPRRPSALFPTGGEAGPRLFNRYFLLFIAGVGLINASHGFLFAFASIYWKGLGISDAVIGFLWTAAVLAEVGIFLVFRRVFGKVSPNVVLGIAGIAACFRWMIFPLLEPAGFGLPGFVFGQSLHALSTGMLLIGLQKMVGETVAEERTGAAQGAAFFANGFSMALVTLVSGPLYQMAGVKGFYAMALVAFIGLALIVASAFSPRARPAAGRPETRDR